MSGYVIANIDVKNPEAYKEYVGKVLPTVQKFGGEYLVRAGEYKVIDGEWKYPRTVAIMNEPANLVIKVAVLSTPLPFRNFLVSKTNW